MDLNLEVCRTIAVQYGLSLQYVVKEFFVFDVLGQIATQTAPSKNLVFKGGTALNKIYLGKLQRFSEDLDFDLDTQSLKQVEDKCREIAGKLVGYEIKEFRRVKDTIQFYCVYEGLNGIDNVRVDVAAKKIITEKPLVVKPAVSFYTQRSVTGFYVYSLEDLVARKLHALGVRTEGKDVYDVYNALPLCGSLGGAIEKMFLSEGKKGDSKEFLEKTVLAVKKTDAKKLAKLTNSFIPLSNRPKDWRELKNDLVFRLENLK